MGKKRLVSILFICLMAHCLGACVSSSTFAHNQPMVPTQEHQKLPKVINTQLAITIPLPNGKGELNAEITRPDRQTTPKTLVILVPGPGNVSRRGEISGNGIDDYATPIEINSLWLKSLSEQGFFVLAYDKRTCSPDINALCRKNPTKDIDEQGISALAGDLDAVYQDVLTRLTKEKVSARVILMSTTQGAQVISLAACAEKAHAIVLLSPIVGDLETAWVNGYKRAKALNREEDTKSLFLSIQKGDFPNKIFGASVQFWRSWMAASTKTLDTLLALNRPVLALLSANDVFNPIKDNNNLRTKNKFIVKNLSQGDRNFIVDGHLSEMAINEVTNFIKKSQ